MINWYPGHMAKTKRLIKEKLELIDIIYEVIDARIPCSSMIKDIDDIIKNKPIILVFTKMDLCDKEETNKWINYYQKSNYKVITFDLMNDKTDPLLNLTNDVLKEINNKRIEKGMKKRIYRAMVIGVPNVGKSTLINRLAGKKKTRVANMPGVTKNLDWIRLSEKLELMDTPGILWPKLDNEKTALNLASTTAIKEEILPLDEVAIHILNILDTYYKDKLNSRYKINSINYFDIEDTLNIIGSNIGCLSKGGEVDIDKVYLYIINDIKDGKIKGITFDRFDQK